MENLNPKNNNAESEKDKDSEKSKTSNQSKRLYTVFINAKSYDFKLLDIAMNTIYQCILQGGIRCNPPSPRPTKRIKFCIRRAPSIYKSSFEKFEFRTHSRLIKIQETDDLDKLICLSKADIPRAVSIDIKILTVDEANEISKKRKEIRIKISKSKLNKKQENVEGFSI